MNVPLCPTCGRSVPVATGKAGRPATYHAPDCATLARKLVEIDGLISALVDDVGRNPSPETQRALEALRGRLWAMGNATNAVGRPVRGPNKPDRKRSGWRGLTVS